MKNILITGAKGQLGSQVKELMEVERDINLLLTDIDELDITDFETVTDFFFANKIDIVINCAAYTAVDRAEDEWDKCYAINVAAVENIARAAVNCNARIIHISTDYVFDGNASSPYNELVNTNPQSVYGETKLAGERALFDIAADSIVIRTAWLYSPFGHNFVKTMIALGCERETLKVVDDQIGSPTLAYDLASVIKGIIMGEKWEAGVFHFTNEGVCSWYDFAKTIHYEYGIMNCELLPVTTAEYPTRAKRPVYSVLDKTKIKQVYGINIPHWHESLKKCIDILKIKD